MIKYLKSTFKLLRLLHNIYSICIYPEPVTLKIQENTTQV